MDGLLLGGNERILAQEVFHGFLLPTHFRVVHFDQGPQARVFVLQVVVLLLQTHCLLEQTVLLPVRENLRYCGSLGGFRSGDRQVLNHALLFSKLLQLFLRIGRQFGCSPKLLLIQVELGDGRTLGLSSRALSLLEDLLEHAACVGPSVKQDWVQFLAPLR